MQVTGFTLHHELLFWLVLFSLSGYQGVISCSEPAAGYISDEHNQVIGVCEKRINHGAWGPLMVLPDQCRREWVASWVLPVVVHERYWQQLCSFRAHECVFTAMALDF